MPNESAKRSNASSAAGLRKADEGRSRAERLDEARAIASQYRVQISPRAGEWFGNAVGQRPPSPATEGKREQQVNIRLTADERTRIEEAARRAGFRSVSDFIRAAALSKTA